MKIRRGCLRFHAAVNETDQVRKMVIAEQPIDGFFAELHTPGVEQAVGIGRDAVGVAKKANV